jgi:hypothetical protein
MDFRIDKPGDERMGSRARAKETALALMESCAELVFYAGGWCVARPLAACFWAPNRSERRSNEGN